MSLFINDAWAQAAGGSEPNFLVSLLPLVVLFALFYFLLIRPQTKRAKEHREMIAAVAKGDEIVTTGGLAGRVTEVGESFLELGIAEGVTVKVQKQAVSTILPKGSLKPKR